MGKDENRNGQGIATSNKKEFHSTTFILTGIIGLEREQLEKEPVEEEELLPSLGEVSTLHRRTVVRRRSKSGYIYIYIYIRIYDIISQIMCVRMSIYC